MITASYFGGTTAIDDLKMCRLRCRVDPRDCRPAFFCYKVLVAHILPGVVPPDKLLTQAGLHAVIETLRYIPYPDDPCSICGKWCGTPHQGVCEDKRVGMTDEPGTVGKMHNLAAHLIYQHAEADPRAALDTFLPLLEGKEPIFYDSEVAAYGIKTIQKVVPIPEPWQRDAPGMSAQTARAYRALQGIIKPVHPNTALSDPDEYTRLEHIHQMSTVTTRALAREALATIKPFVPITVEIGPVEIEETEEPKPRSETPVERARRRAAIATAITIGLLLGAGTIGVIAYRDYRRGTSPA